MINILTKLAQKPSDKSIRIVRIVFALLLLLVIYFGWSVTAVNFGLPTELKHAFYIFPLVGFIRGILDPGIFRKKLWKWTIVSLGALMLLTSLFLIDDATPTPMKSDTPMTVSGEGISLVGLDREPTVSAPFTLSTDNWFGFFAPFLILMGLLLNGKNITTKNVRHAEIVKKIRV